MADSNILIYLVRRDLRVLDNPILHHLASVPDHGFTRVLPVYVLPAHQMAVSGLIPDQQQNPYPEARSKLGGFWRCGPHRAKFIAQSVWNLKKSLESLDSGLILRVGTLADVTQRLLQGLKDKGHKVGAVWMIAEEGVEEKRDEREVALFCKKQGAELRLWVDEKYLVDDRDLEFQLLELPDVFGTYKKKTEPLREKPRQSLAAPKKSELPPLVPAFDIPDQVPPFVVPGNYQQFEEALLRPIKQILPTVHPPAEDVPQAYPLQGGEDSAHARLRGMLSSNVMKNYHSTHKSLFGIEFSTMLSAFLSQGCLTARQVHEAIKTYEDGTDSTLKNVEGYGKGENDATRAVRGELLWRDFMRLCSRKFEHKLFRLEGFKGMRSERAEKWKSPDERTARIGQEPAPEEIERQLDRFKTGTTGMGLIDASQRELLHTGYTSNRARLNVATFLAKHLLIDWRYGAEWYEMLLVDYDVSSNWGNWQYVAGVGLDPRGASRMFNPVKQAFDYDKQGVYVRMWVPELAQLQKLENVFQVWTTSAEELEAAGLTGNIMVTEPVKKIVFEVNKKPRKSRQTFTHQSGGTGRPVNTSTDGPSSLSTDGPPRWPRYQGPNRQGYPRGSQRGSYRGQSRSTGRLLNTSTEGPPGPSVDGPPRGPRAQGHISQGYGRGSNPYGSSYRGGRGNVRSSFGGRGRGGQSSRAPSKTGAPAEGTEEAAPESEIAPKETPSGTPDDSSTDKMWKDGFVTGPKGNSGGQNRA